MVVHPGSTRTIFDGGWLPLQGWIESGSGPVTRFVRVGTLDDPDALPPDVHIFTASKQPWVVLPTAPPAFAEYYDRKNVWAKESLARFEQLRPLIEPYRAGPQGAA